MFLYTVFKLVDLNLFIPTGRFTNQYLEVKEHLQDTDLEKRAECNTM